MGRRAGPRLPTSRPRRRSSRFLAETAPLASCVHDAAEGGLAVALAEAAIAAGVGAEVELEPDAVTLFGEGGGRAIVTVRPATARGARRGGRRPAPARSGRSAATRSSDVTVSELATAYESGLAEAARLMCGIFGIYAPDRDVARLTHFGLVALQHRGQESAGIAVTDDGHLMALRDMGLVAQVFSEDKLRGLAGQAAIGHTRYSTTGSTMWTNAQPSVQHGDGRAVAIGHNGNLTNTTALRDELVASGCRLRSTSDTEVIAALVAREPGTLEEAIAATMAKLDGAYAIVLALRGQARRLPRPARHPSARARTARRRLRARLGVVRVRPARRASTSASSRPGELVVVDGDGLRSVQALEPKNAARLCIFELIYFARPDTRLGGGEVHGARVRMGERLAREAPADADVVMPIPDSGMPAAIGFARRAGIPYNDGLIKNRYVGRTFIQPDQALREHGIRTKFNPLAEVCGAARDHRRRLDRPRDDDTEDRRDAVRGRRPRGARARLVAADRVALLLRHRHGHRGGARRRRPEHRGDPEPRWVRRASPTCRSRDCRTRSAGPRASSAAPA